MTTRPQTVKLTQTSPTKVTLVFKLIDIDTFTGGVGGWTVTDVKRSKQSTAWTGLPALVYTLPLRLDGITARGTRSIEGDIQRLLAMGRPNAQGAKLADPPVLGLTGNVQTSATIKWVLTQLTPGEMRRDAKGVIVQQDFTIELTEYVAGNAKRPAAAAKAKAKAKAKTLKRSSGAMHGN